MAKITIKKCSIHSNTLCWTKIYLFKLRLVCRCSLFVWQNWNLKYRFSHFLWRLLYLSSLLNKRTERHRMISLCRLPVIAYIFRLYWIVITYNRRTCLNLAINVPFVVSLNRGCQSDSLCTNDRKLANVQK